MATVSSCMSRRGVQQQLDAVLPWESDLAGTAWTLTGLYDLDTAKFAGASISFDDTGCRVWGNGGCNTFSGYYLLRENNDILLATLVFTRKMCLNDNAEAQFAKALNYTETYSINGDTLKFYDIDKIPIATFQKIKRF
ncbi:MAG: META domain-containing protein [Tannerella sp.]|jgi:heat shock protein HslJ|nr:META domain-containing protein [Tannerella sp.]